MKLVLIFVCLCVQYGSSLNCYWNTECPYKMFSSRTAYNAVRGDIRDSIIKLTGCEPISIWGLVRHGKSSPRYVPMKHMKEALVIRDTVISSYDSGNSSLCAQDVDNLRQWKLEKKMIETTQPLDEEGFQDSQGIGFRLKQAFPNLLGVLNKENYTFRSSKSNRIQDTAKAFISGIQSQGLVPDEIREDYDIMDPYDHCPKYLSGVVNNLTTYVEKEKYHISSEYLAMKDRIRRRAGLDYDLNAKNITALYDWCRHTWSGMNNRLSPWCALFTIEDLEVLEYDEDMKRYYKNGYGIPVNLEMGKIPLADLLKKFQEVKEGQGKKIVVYFTHASMVEMVLSTLNLFKDDSPLTGAYSNTMRKWRNSKICPFSANLLAVLNRCNQENDYKVVFYLNEEPLTPICNNGVCTWQEFEDKLKTFSSAKPDFC